MADLLTPDLLKIAAESLGTIGVSIIATIKFFANRTTADKKAISEEIRTLSDRTLILENENKFLKEKIDSERIDFKERLKEITNYMYNNRAR